MVDCWRAVIWEGLIGAHKSSFQNPRRLILTAASLRVTSTSLNTQLCDTLTYAPMVEDNSSQITTYHALPDFE